MGPFVDRPVKATSASRGAARRLTRSCAPRAFRLCRGHGSMEDIFHLPCECPHPAMWAAQAVITAALPALVTTVRHQGRQRHATDPVREIAARTDSSSTRKFPTLVYRCLLGGARRPAHALAALPAVQRA